MSTCPLLLDHGADILAKDSIGHTALMLAAVSGKLELIKMLVKAGADISAKEKYMGYTAIDIARYEGKNEVYEYLKRIYKNER